MLARRGEDVGIIAIAQQKDLRSEVLTLAAKINPSLVHHNMAEESLRDVQLEDLYGKLDVQSALVAGALGKHCSMTDWSGFHLVRSRPSASHASKDPSKLVKVSHQVRDRLLEVRHFLPFLCLLSFVF